MNSTKIIAIAFLFSQSLLAFDMPKLPSAPPAMPKLPEAPKAPTANPEIEKKVNDYLAKNSEANKFMQKSSDALFKIVAPKTEVEKVDAYVKKAEAMTDEKQKAASIKKAQTYQMQIINKALADEKSMKSFSNLNAQDKVSLGKIAYNMHLAIMRDKELAAQGPDVLKAASSDPLIIKRSDEIKTAMNETKEQMENGQKLVVGVSKIAASNGVKVEMPKTAQDAPQ